MTRKRTACHSHKSREHPRRYTRAVLYILPMIIVVLSITVHYEVIEVGKVQCICAIIHDHASLAMYKVKLLMLASLP